MALPFFTIGHSTRTLAQFATILQGADVAVVADIRTIARSRRNPQFNAATLPDSLRPFAIDYAAFPDLGGLRAMSKTIGVEVNGFCRTRAFTIMPTMH